jgi:zinc transport system substrate-binding protein
MNSRQAAFLGTLSAVLLVATSWAYVAFPGATDDDGRLQVVATFYPLYYFASEIGGNRTHVSSLIPFNSEPHSWQPAPSDIVKADRADVFVYNGAGVEPWVGKLLGTLQNRNSMNVVDTSRGIDMLKGDADNPSGRNPHFWIDPVRAKSQVDNIKAGLAAADPAGAAYYGQRADGLKTRLDALDSDFREGLRNRTKDTIVTTHEGFDYLAARYSFSAHSVLGISPDQEPSARKMMEIVDIVNEHGLDVVFGEPVYSDKFMRTVAGEVSHRTGRNVRVLVLDGIHGRAGPHAGMDYFQIQQDNLKNLEIGLGAV